MKHLLRSSLMLALGVSAGVFATEVPTTLPDGEVIVRDDNGTPKDRDDDRLLYSYRNDSTSGFHVSMLEADSVTLADLGELQLFSDESESIKIFTGTPMDVVVTDVHGEVVVSNLQSPTALGKGWLPERPFTITLSHPDGRVAGSIVYAKGYNVRRNTE